MIELSVVDRLEKLPLSRFHYKLLVVLGVPYCFVAMDLLLISLVLPSVQAEFGLPGGLAGFLAGSVFIGMSVGAASWGYLADLIGRKRALELTILIYTSFTAVSSLVQDWGPLILFRVLAGVGLGGCIPLCFVFLSEFIPAEHRGKFLVLLDSFWAYGWIAATFLGFLVVPSLGWRTLFLVGGFPIVTLLLVHYSLPESLRYLEGKGKTEEVRQGLIEIEKRTGIKLSTEQSTTTESSSVRESSKVSVRELWSRQYRKRTVFAWVMWFCMVYGYYSLFLWVTGFMRSLGYELPEALFFNVVTSLAQLPGYFSAAWLIDVVGRKPTLTVYLVLTAVSTLGFATAGSAMEVLIWLSAISLFCLGAWGVVMTYCAEVYPTRVRGTGYGAASGFGRIAGIVGPTIAGFLLSSYGLFITLLVTASVFLVEVVDVLVLGIETKGKTLEEISK